MLEASLAATAGTTTHRLTASKSHRAYGDGERSLGRPADPRRIAQARLHGLRTHGVAVSAPSTDETVPDLADIPRELLRQPACTATVTSSFVTSAEDVDASVLPCPPVPPSCARLPASTQWAVVDGPPAHQPTSLCRFVAQDQLRRRTRTRFRCGKDPPAGCLPKPGALDAGPESRTSRISRQKLLFGSCGSDIEALPRHSCAVCHSVCNVSRGSRLALRS